MRRDWSPSRRRGSDYTHPELHRLVGHTVDDCLDLARGLGLAVSERIFTKA